MSGDDNGEGYAALQQNALEDQELLSSSTRALKNDLVLDKVLSYLKLPDLKATSLVNRQWSNASRLWMIKLSVPAILNPGDLSDYYENNRTLTIQNMTELIGVISTKHGIFPSPKFQVDTDLVQNANDEQILGKFFQAVAPIAEDIIIFCPKKETYRLKKMPRSTVEYSKLKRLHFIVPMFSRDTIPSSAMRWFAGILHQAPNLQHILLYTSSRSGSRTMNLLIDAMDSVQGRKIKRLTLAGAVDDQPLIRLGTIGLNLQAFAVNFHLPIEMTEPKVSLKSFLQSQSSSLEELNIVNCLLQLEDEPDFEPVELPKLAKLKRLWVSSGSGTTDGLLFSGINYNKLFPNLTSFSLDGYGRDLEAFFNSEMKPFEQLNELKLPCTVGEDLNWVLHAARIFPNVQKLQIVAQEEVLKNICKAFGNVEELVLVFEEEEETADKVLTGYTSEELEEISKLSERMRQLVENWVRMPSEFLQKLKVLRMDDEPISKPEVVRTTFTDHACRLVLLKLRCLQCLDLVKYRSAKISKDVLAEMRNKFLVLCEAGIIV